jgi:type I restriction enzyme S subunit
MSVVGKQGYKETEIGWIPSDWQIRAVGEICDVKGGKRLPKGEVLTEEDTGFPYIRVTDMRMGGVSRDGILYVPAHVQSTIAQYTISKDDIFISVAGSLGIVGVIPACLDGANLTENADKLTNIKICRDYLSYVLRSDQIQSAIQREGTTSAQPKLALGRIREFVIPVPSDVEQQKIAAILTAVDDKLHVIAREIEATQDLKQGLMWTMFSRGLGTQDTAGRWVPHTEFQKKSSLYIPAPWNLERLGDIAPLIRRPVQINLETTYPELGLRSYGKGTFHKPALLGTEVGNKRLFEIKTGDLLFSNVFAWEGAVAVAKLEDDGRYGSHRYITCAVDETRADTTYVFRYLTTPAGIASLTLASPGGAGRNKTLGLSALANITMPLPPLAEQRKITQILDGIDAKLQALALKQSAVKALKRGLMQKLLSGEWRVPLDTHQETAIAA